MNQSRPVSSSIRRPGFTLVELMISIALSLLLIVGINAIFRTTADTVGVSQATLSGTRDLRNSFDALNSDFNGFMSQSSQPAFVIYSQNNIAFRDANDQKSADPAYAITPSFENALHQLDSAGNILPSARLGAYGNNVTGIPVVADNRNHRVDILLFFANGRFRRQTGFAWDGTTDFSTWQSNYTSDSAYIWYGHCAQPYAGNPTTWFINTGQYLPPGATNVNGSPQLTAATNPYNFYASQWVLGRNAILLGSPGNNGAIQGTGSSLELYLDPAQNNNFRGAVNGPLAPFIYGQAAKYSNTGPPPYRTRPSIWRAFRRLPI